MKKVNITTAVLLIYQSHKEIAAALGISTKTVEFHITKALKVLRVALKDYFPLLAFFPRFFC